ncbi:MAG TPA: DUF4116 domain-containing protein, partial [Anaerovoracaceae bacterium]|nr:DUF4116 domain-containing protein [Anaerovoracaceae bacterium]
MDFDELVERIEFSGQEVIYTDLDDEEHVIGYMLTQSEWYENSDKILEEVTGKFLLHSIYSGTTLAELAELTKHELMEKIEEFSLESDDEMVSVEHYLSLAGAYSISSVIDFCNELPEEIADYCGELEENLVEKYWSTDDYDSECDEINENVIDEFAEKVNELSRYDIRGEYYPIYVQDIDFSKITDKNVIEEMAGACHNYDYSKSLMEGISKEVLVEAMDVIYTDSIEEYVQTHIIDDEELARAVLINNGNFLSHMPEDITNNIELVAIAVRNDGSALEYAAEKYRDDINIVKLALQHEGSDGDLVSTIENIQHASERLLDNEELVSFAFEQNEGWKALGYLSDRYKNDKEIASWAVSQDPAMLEHVAETLKNDPEVVLSALNAPDSNESYKFARVRDHIGQDLKKTINIDWYGSVAAE